MEKVSLLGYQVSRLLVTDIVKNALSANDRTVVNTINPHSYVEAKKDSAFKTALVNSDLLIPDGSGIVVAASFLKNIKLNKIAGFDLFKETLTQLNLSNGSVFFLGSSTSVLNKIEEKILIEYPNVKVKTLSPPFKDEFSQDDCNNFISSVNEFSPDVLFVGLTAPKQEKLIDKIKGNINVKMVSGIGAVFDFYSGNVKRPATIWLKLHLEWLVRFIGEPKRLWRRNFISTPIFLKDLVVSKISLLRDK
ncbi:TPA: WecB/TagA/CpsF family glycosyltransferase [Photobacterium damselae]